MEVETPIPFMHVELEKHIFQRWNENTFTANLDTDTYNFLKNKYTLGREFLRVFERTFNPQCPPDIPENGMFTFRFQSAEEFCDFLEDCIDKQLNNFVITYSDHDGNGVRKAMGIKQYLDQMQQEQVILHSSRQKQRSLDRQWEQWYQVRSFRQSKKGQPST